MLIVALHQCVRGQMFDLVVFLLPTLIKLTAATIKVISTTAMQALLALFTDPAMLPLISKLSSIISRSQHGAQRLHCMRLIRHILRLHSMEHLIKYKAPLHSALAAGETDKLSEIRDVAKEGRAFFNFYSPLRSPSAPVEGVKA